MSHIGNQICTVSAARKQTLLLGGDGRMSGNVTDGKDGYTPIRGTDYWTPEDEAAIREDSHAYITEELSKRGQLKPEFANNVSELESGGDAAKLYVLPDGYVYAYMRKRISVTHNAYDPATAQFNARHSSSGGVGTTNGSILLPKVAVDPSWSDCLIHISGLAQLYPAYYTVFQIGYWKTDGTLKRVLTASAVDGTNWESGKSADLPITVNARFLKDGNGAEYWGSDVGYLTVALGIGSASVTAADAEGLTVNFARLNVERDEYGWFNTGHAFVPADYEDRIVELETEVAAHGVSIGSLEARMETVESGSGAVAVPTHWQSAVDSAIRRVKAVQDTGGADTVTFALFSDVHVSDGDTCTVNLGRIAAAVMNACHIPVAVLTGDAMSNGALDSEAEVLRHLDMAAERLAPIGKDRLLWLRGNHDDVWGRYAVSDTQTNYYVNKVSSAKIWNAMHRAQAEDLRRVFGGDGTYFYLDNTPQKTRFVCLNTHFYEGSEITDGTGSQMSAGFGDAQLAWLADTALQVPADDWTVLLFTHVPPTDQRIDSRVHLTGLPDGEAFRTAVKTARERGVGIKAVFSGHCHNDAIVTDPVMGIPVVTVVCAGNFEYDYAGDGSLTRYPETSANLADETRWGKSTALDLVSVNRKTGRIDCVRLGVGEDRVYTSE